KSGNKTIKDSLQMGAKIVECKSENLEKLISKHLKTKWILTLREDEILPYGQQSFLADILEDEKDKCAFMVEILDVKTNEMRVEERLILRNVLKTKIQKNIDDYDVKDIDITIYENYL
ncbi:MAG: hypothetical protein ACRC28_03985, partial [Clostridium sp.]|uniref:hypothetical protein n=1 Tax=Clostridium sp. TaxID=1506 RepID=UPI003F331C92